MPSPQSGFIILEKPNEVKVSVFTVIQAHDGKKKNRACVEPVIMRAWQICSCGSRIQVSRAAGDLLPVHNTKNFSPDHPAHATIPKPKIEGASPRPVMGIKWAMKSPETAVGPSLKELIVARLNFVRRDLDYVLARVTDEMLKWAPAAGVRPLDDQLLEIAMNEVMSVALLRDGVTLSHAEAEATLVHDGTAASLKQVLADVRKSTSAYIDSLSADELEEAVVAGNPWFASFGLKKVPRYDALTSIALHEHYHVGQLVTYLWTMGHDPYAW